MLVSTPYHWGRQREDMLAEWNRNLLAIAKHPHNIIASNNKCVASCLHLLKRYATQPSPQHRSHGRTTCQSRGVMLRSGQARPRSPMHILVWLEGTTSSTSSTLPSYTKLTRTPFSCPHTAIMSTPATIHIGPRF